MNIAVGSCFRDCAGRQIDRFLDQVQALMLHVGPSHNVRVIAVEGNSLDYTRLELVAGAKRRSVELTLHTCNVAGPRYGSVELPERLEALSAVGNAILSGVEPADDVLVYVESDLIWGPHEIGSLIDAAYTPTQFDVFAPLVFAGQHFYDVWGFRGLDGERFAPFAPYHASLRGTEQVEVSSVGSCLVMRREIAERCRMRNGGALVDFCGDVRARGYKIAVWPLFRVEHPA